VYDARKSCIALLEQRMVGDRAGEITIRMHGADTSELARWFEERMAERNRQFGYADLKPISSGPLASEVRSIGKRQRLDPAEGSGSPAVLAPQLVPAPVEAFDKPHREVFISYAWGDASDEGKERQRIVDELVAALRNHPQEITVRIDRDEMHPGQLISAFMDRLAAADRVIVEISDKYLRSEYCMYELFMLYQNCSKNADRFHRCIMPIILPDAKLTEGLAARLQRAFYWNNQDADLQSLLTANLQAVGPNTYRKCYLIGEFARNTSEMLEYLIDQLQPRDYDRQMAEGFTELCQQILAD
jgi:internalin A